MSKPVRFGIVAGEKSGDILGAGLISALRQHYPGAEFVGIGGPAMIGLGCRSLAPMDRLSAMGFVEPLGRLPELLRIKRMLEKTFIDHPPAAYIGIDSPDFNLLIEKKLKRRHIKTVHYVSPSVWAYRARRIFRIKAAVDLMLTLFPFETGIYKQHDIGVACVGHPLADQIDFEDRKSAQRQRFGLNTDEKVIALLPGSRGGEISRLGPVFLDAAMAVLSQYVQVRFLIPYSGDEARVRIEALLNTAGIIDNERFLLVPDSQAAMAAADFVLLASGTATLEAMLLRRPMIVCYKLAPLTYAVASRIVRIPFFALPNLLAGKALVPEYLQQQVTTAALKDEMLDYLERGKMDAVVLAEFERMHRLLRRNASATAAGAIANLLGDSRR